MVHVDVKKLGNIPDGGGWRYVGRHQGEKNRAATQDKSRNVYGNPKLGYAFVHTVIDDHSRVAYTEVHDDETAFTAVAVLRRAVDWFADRGVAIERVLSDNGGAYRSHLWRDTCEALSITPKRTRPYRPQTNGKVCESVAWCCTGRSDPGQGVTTVSCVRFVGRFRCSAVERAGQTDLT